MQIRSNWLVAAAAIACAGWGCSQKTEVPADTGSTSSSSASTENSGPAGPPAPAAPAAQAPAADTGGGKPAAPGDNPAAVKKGEKVVTLPSGLKYVDVKVGKGPEPKQGDLVTVEYTGWLQDGTVFDSSTKHGDGTFQFDLGGQVIQGWNIGVATMKVGGERKLIIPPDLAYGENGTPGGPIGPNATLTFDIKLLKIEHH